MTFKAYLSSLKLIDTRLVDLYTKRIRKRKRNRVDDNFLNFEEILSTREKFCSIFKDEENMEDDFFNISDVLKDTDNVNTKEFDYEPSNYLG
jgi:hypothetical protein